MNGGEWDGLEIGLPHGPAEWVATSRNCGWGARGAHGRRARREPTTGRGRNSTENAAEEAIWSPGSGFWPCAGQWEVGSSFPWVQHIGEPPDIATGEGRAISQLEYWGRVWFAPPERFGGRGSIWMMVWPRHQQ